MTNGEQDREKAAGRGLLERVVVGLRRVRAGEAAAEGVTAKDREVATGDHERLLQLEARVEHLQAELEALQDAVHREATRRDDRIAELQEKVKPRAMAQALSADARERGIGQ